MYFSLLKNSHTSRGNIKLSFVLSQSHLQNLFRSSLIMVPLYFPLFCCLFTLLVHTFSLSFAFHLFLRIYIFLIYYLRRLFLRARAFVIVYTIILDELQIQLLIIRLISSMTLPLFIPLLNTNLFFILLKNLHSTLTSFLWFPHLLVYYVVKFKRFLFHSKTNNGIIKAIIVALTILTERLHRYLISIK